MLIWHKQVMDNSPVTPDGPECTSPTMAIFEHVHVDESTDTTYMFTCELCKLKTTIILTSKKSPDESPQNAFKSLPKMSKVFVKINTGVPASAACERLFSVGKDVFSAKRNQLSDKNGERLLMCRVNKRFCPGI